MRDFLQHRLPDYMLPSAFVMLDALPLTANGKLDRKALPAPEYQSQESFVAPRTPLEDKLAGIFTEVLKIDRVGIHDNFFELGGHSLLVMRLIAEIESALGQRFSVATVFQSPTIARIGALVQTGEATDQWEMLVPINPGGDTPPLFTAFVGLATELRVLGRELGAAQRFYGISAQCCDPKRAPLTTIEELAACYLNEVRALQPHGPYYLSGECVGGVVALEMAQQLRACGQRVAMLVLLDAPPPPALMNARWPERKRDARKQPERALSRKLLDLLKRPIGSAMRVAKRMVFRMCVRFRLSYSHEAWDDYVLDIQNRARTKYIPRAYAGKVSFIWATIGANLERDARYEQAWRMVVADSEHHRLAVKHGTMFREPEVKLLAGQMKIYLAEARAAQAWLAGSPARTSQGQQPEARVVARMS
ncbi:MAG: hypothetical protein H0V78_02040 [Burkholderiales bacterium]|nr:hypothetical protein [Burkholderiales bacterium]